MRFLLLAGIITFSFAGHAGDCQGFWNYTLDTNPTHPKGLSGDTSNGYAILSWKTLDPNLKIVLKGQYPRGRFFSVETYLTQKLFVRLDARIDQEIVPDEGSENPFQEGSRIDAKNRNYTIEIVTPDQASQAANTLKMKQSGLVRALMMRLYSPNEGVGYSVEDLPKVYVINANNGEPLSCDSLMRPKQMEEGFYLNLPQSLMAGIRAKTHFGFFDVSMSNGTNPAIPYYVNAVNRIPFGKVTVVKFKAPSSYLALRTGTGIFHNEAQTRYWSLCLQNWVRNETLACVPDHLAIPDQDGFVTIVIGRGPEVKAHAEKRGIAFLEDSRREVQKVMGFAYRNVMPSVAFENGGAMYQGDYRPAGQVCSTEVFLSDRCK